MKPFSTSHKTPDLIDIFSGCITHKSNPEISQKYQKYREYTFSSVESHLQAGAETGSHERRLGMTELSVFVLLYGSDSRLSVLIITPNCVQIPHK